MVMEHRPILALERKVKGIAENNTAIGQEAEAIRLKRQYNLGPQIASKAD